jgi:hypothetical protein
VLVHLVLNDCGNQTFKQRECFNLQTKSPLHAADITCYLVENRLHKYNLLQPGQLEIIALNLVNKLSRNLLSFNQEALFINTMHFTYFD